MAAITICSDFGAQKNKVCHCFPIYFPWTDGSHPYCCKWHFILLHGWILFHCVYVCVCVCVCVYLERLKGKWQWTFVSKIPFGKALLGPLQQQGRSRTNNRFPNLLPKGGQLVACIVWRQGSVQWSGLGWLGCFAYSLGGGVFMGQMQYPAFVPALCFCSLLFKSGIWVFSSVCIFCP